VQQYVLLVQAAIDSRQAELRATAGGTLRPLRVIDPTVGIPGTLSRVDLDAIDQLCDAYLPAGLSALSSAVKSQSVQVIADFTGTDVITVSLSFVALVVLYVGYYMPTILALDAQLKRTRFLLLLCEFSSCARTARALRSRALHAVCRMRCCQYQTHARPILPSFTRSRCDLLGAQSRRISRAACLPSSTRAGSSSKARCSQVLKY
jgi:hypothetical protein